MSTGGGRFDELSFNRVAVLVGEGFVDVLPTPASPVYDTSFNPGWIAVGGTSASSPFIAGVVGLAGNGTTVASGFLHHQPGAFFDVVGGANGYCGSGHDYLCNRVKGYDDPTWVSVDGIPTDSKKRGLVVIPTISRRKPSNTNSIRIGK